MKVLNISKDEYLKMVSELSRQQANFVKRQGRGRSTVNTDQLFNATMTPKLPTNTSLSPPPIKRASML